MNATYIERIASDVVETINSCLHKTIKDKINSYTDKINKANDLSMSKDAWKDMTRDQQIIFNKKAMNREIKNGEFASDISKFVLKDIKFKVLNIMKNYNSMYDNNIKLG